MPSAESVGIKQRIANLDGLITVLKSNEANIPALEMTLDSIITEAEIMRRELYWLNRRSGELK